MNAQQIINLKVVESAGGGSMEVPAVPNTGTEALASLLTNNYSWLVPLALAAAVLAGLVILTILRGKGFWQTLAGKALILAFMALPVFGFVSLNASGRVEAADMAFRAEPSQVDLIIDKNQAEEQLSRQVSADIVVADFSGYQYGITANLATTKPSGVTIQLDKQVLDQASPITITSQQTQADSYSQVLTVAIDDSLTAGDYQLVVKYELAEVSAPVAQAKLMDGGNFQDTTIDPTEMCSALTVYNGTNPEAIVFMTDARDYRTYMAARLADGNCWMLNNLRISLDDVVRRPELSNPGVGVEELRYVGHHDSGGLFHYDLPRYYDRPNMIDIKYDDFYGYLYNWCAATGGAADTCTASGTAPADVTTDICPAGWRLPTGTQTGEFAMLNAKMNDAAASAPSTTNYFANWQFDGAFRGVFSNLWEQGLRDWPLEGYWWSSSRNENNPDTAYGVKIDQTTVEFEYEADRSLGYAVRCLTK
jgi:uncharacterized protein (TIGR02145 family)